MREQSDRKGPEIICSDQAVTEYDPDMSDAQLLEGVKATDDKDGDVSDSLTVESVYEVDDSNVVVTYVAKDSANNITKLKRNMSVDPDKMKNSTNSQKAKKSEDNTDVEPTPVPVEDVETTESGESTGETSDVQDSDASLTPTPEPTDTASQIAAEQEKKADEMPAQSPKIYLSEYYVTTAVGSSVDLLSYVKDIQDDKDETYELWRRIQITGEVNTAVAGTYTCTYYVMDTDGNMSNNAELTVVVE